MGRYYPGEHEEPILCSNDDCTARNSLESSAVDDDTCWRCDAPLKIKPSIGDIVTVDIIDQQDTGESIGKTPSGFVLFIDTELSTIEATVEVTDIEATSGTAVHRPHQS